MARRRPMPCTVKGCPALTTKGRCDKHRSEAEAKRGNSTQRGYDSAWRKTRAEYLRVHPFCQDEAGCIEPATDVHHIDGLGPRGPLGHDFDNLMALCHAHHSQITSREQPGGIVRRD